MDQYQNNPQMNNVQQSPPVQPVYQQQNPYQPQTITENMLPPQFRPLSPWAYFGYTILFTIPLIGFILLIVFSVDSSNINRRNFARSYWCVLVLVVILVVISSLVFGASVLPFLDF